MDPPEYAWSYDASTNTIVATTTTVVRTYIHLGCIHEVAEPDIPPIPTVILEALLGQLPSPWDFPLSPLSDIEMEPMSLRLSLIEIQPQLMIPVVELSSIAILRTTVASPPYPEYH